MEKKLDRKICLSHLPFVLLRMLSTPQFPSSPDLERSRRDIGPYIANSESFIRDSGTGAELEGHKAVETEPTGAYHPLASRRIVVVSNGGAFR